MYQINFDKVQLPTSIQLGADPECFFVDKSNRPVSAEGLLGGTKENPKPFGNVPGFAIQEDGVAAEFNIPPAVTAAQFSQNISISMTYLRHIAKEKKLRVKIVPELSFDDASVNTPQTRRVGCVADFNAWTADMKSVPHRLERIRTGGGHVHIGFLRRDLQGQWPAPPKQAPVTMDTILLFARMCDLFLTIPSLLVTQPSNRRKFYGAPGSIRPKVYGFEYRSLDNFWLRSVRYQRQVFSNVQAALAGLSQDAFGYNEFLTNFAYDIQKTIMEHDVEKADMFCDKLHIPRFV